MFDDMQRKFDKTIELFSDDLNSVKTGRAKPSLIEHIQVEAYEGTKMPLIELASVTAPDPHMLMVSPWDQSVIAAIETAIRKTQSGLNPVVDGQVIRIAIPALTEERRKEFVKLVKQKAESAREMVRSSRNDMKRELDKQKKEDGVSEDDVSAWMKEMQDLYNVCIGRIDEIAQAKEKELMEI